jgi:hypothetical protein
LKRFFVLPVLIESIIKQFLLLLTNAGRKRTAFDFFGFFTFAVKKPGDSSPAGCLCASGCASGVLRSQNTALGASWGRFAATAQRARDWRGCGNFVSEATAQPGPECVSTEPRKARFFAEQKMRPNHSLQGETLYK